jgi:hypothetical protein
MAIAKHTSDFLGEVSKLYLIPSDYFISDPEPDSNFEVDFETFSLKTGKSFENIYFSPRSCNFSENHSDENAGDLYNKDISFRLPKNRSDVATWLNQNRNKRWTALVMTADDTWILVSKYLKLLSKRTLPASSDQFNGWEVSITGKDKSACPIVLNVPY